MYGASGTPQKRKLSAEYNDGKSDRAPIGTASINSMESDLGCKSRVYFDNVTLTPQKPCQTLAAKQTVTTFRNKHLLKMKFRCFLKKNIATNK